MENAMRLPGFALLATQEKYRRCLEAIAATSSKQVSVIKLKQVFEKSPQPAQENEKDWYIQKINEYNVLHRADEHYIKSVQERVAIYIRSLRKTKFKDKYWWTGFSRSRFSATWYWYTGILWHSKLFI